MRASPSMPPLLLERRVPRVLFAVVAPLQSFFRMQAASGILLLLAAALALAWANSPWHHGYHAIFHAPLEIRLAGRGLSWPLHHWINDALMVVFFLVAGMEIKREIAIGELRSLRRAALPLIAAVGGMVVPAGIYAFLNAGGPGMPGWGVPMATDIAFALGCLTLIRARVPPSLFVFLTALAIFDDLGAIVVIAVFYGGKLDLGALGAAAVLTGGLGLLAYLKVQRIWPYLAVGLALWGAFLLSGVHATLAGVILGLALPARPLRMPGEVLDDLDEALDSLRHKRDADRVDDGAIAAVERHLESVQPPLDRLLHGIHGFVAFGIVPLFALANAGVTLGGGAAALATSPVSVGAFLGLVAGKPIGVFGATFLAVKVGVAQMPARARWAQVFGVSITAGIGFTMSLFIGGLAFGQNAELVDAGKVGVLAASGVCALGSIALLWAVGRPVAAGPETTDMPVVSRLPRFAPGYRLVPWNVVGELVGKTLEEADVRARFGVNILGVWRGGAKEPEGLVSQNVKLESVGPSYRMTLGDTLLLAGEDRAVDRFVRRFGGELGPSEGVPVEVAPA